jgi:hypothetical protein
VVVWILFGKNEDLLDNYSPHAVRNEDYGGLIF